MPCYYPLEGYQTFDKDGTPGRVVFSELKKHGSTLRPLDIPCGQCIGCKIDRSKAWAVRCVHEAQMWQDNVFITLTYNDENKPYRGQLTYEHFQKFIRALRKRHPEFTIRFYMCGEYGEDTKRPHYHAIIFNYGFPDKKKIRLLESGCTVYRSDELEKLWPYGMSSIGAVTLESARYVAAYCLKKITGPNAPEHYERVDELGFYELEPEFSQMSLKPGIGSTWLKKYAKDIYNHDHAIMAGKKIKVPRYYDKVFQTTNEEEIEWIKFERTQKSIEHYLDNTPERREVKATVAKEKAKLFKRNEK